MFTHRTSRDRHGGCAYSGPAPPSVTEGPAEQGPRAPERTAMLDSMLQDTFDRVLRRNPGEPEFHQAVREVFESLEVVQSRHPEYQDHGILMRLC